MIVETRPAEFYLKWVIAVSTLIRCVAACWVELGNDEVYYFTYAVQPDWNHFDHPPLVGLAIRLTTLNLHWVNDFSVRLPAILGAAGSTWLIARCGSLIRNERAGLLAALLYTSSLYTSIISGLFILPDSIQLFFWMAALYTAIAVLVEKNAARQSRWMVGLGIWIGLATLCKVHGLFLWLGVLGYCVFFERSFFRNPWLYVSLCLTCLLLSPIVFWNISNEWISWQFHSQRVEANNGIHFDTMLINLLGQLAYQNPINVYLYVVALIAVFKRKPVSFHRVLWLLISCSLPIIIVTLVVSMFRSTLPHWSGPGFLGLILLTATFLDEQLTQLNNVYKIVLKSSLLLVLIVIVSGVLLINFYPGTLNYRPEPKTGSGDFTLDMYGWDDFAQAFAQLHRHDVLTGRMASDAPIVINKWFPGGHLFYYVAYPLKLRLVGIGTLRDLHKFSWMNQIQGSVAPGGDAYFITPSNNFSDPENSYRGMFRSIEQLSRIEQKRNGKTARYWYVYRLREKLPD